MAKRLVFIADNKESKRYYREELTEFQYYSGFAISQKQKSIQSLHHSFLEKHPESRILEISTKSEIALGMRLSAFNLKYTDINTGADYPLENVFQASKVYRNGGPYTDLLKVSPAEAKKDTRHHTSGELIGFQLDEWICKLEPKTMFYDWIYCKSLSQNEDLARRLIEAGYNAFTDIEFNQTKSINCQARAVAIFVSLYNRGLLEEYLDDKEMWERIYQDGIEKPIAEQLRLDLLQD